MYISPQVPVTGSTSLRYSIYDYAVKAYQSQDLFGPVLPTSAWQHIVVTQEGSLVVLYENGAEVANSAGVTYNPSVLGTTMNNWLGRSQFSADPYFHGEIDQFRLYARALSGAEVQELFQEKL